MIIKFRNPDDKVYETHKNLGNNLQFYPLYIDRKENFYGLIFVPRVSEKDISKLFSSNFFELLDHIDENVLFFKTKRLFQFYYDLKKIMKPFMLNDGFVYFFTPKDEKWHEDFLVEYINEPDFKYCSFRDNFIHELNLLGTLVMSAKYLKKKEKESLILAMNFGYPLSDVVDFQEKKVISNRDEIIQKWSEKTSFEYEIAEKNFVKMLRKSTRDVIHNNVELFERVSSSTCTGNDSITAKLFLRLLERNQTRKNIYSEKNMPRLFISKITVESVFTIIKKRKDDLQKNFSIFFRNYPIKSDLIYEGESVTLPSSYGRYRIAFSWDLSSENVTISELMNYVEDLKEGVMAALKRTDKDSFSRRQELWIKSLNISLFLPNSFSDTAYEVIKEYFNIFIDKNDKKQLIEKKIFNKNFCFLEFKIWYPRFHDYQISERKFGYFYKIHADDELTRQGVEAAYKLSFSKSLHLLERAAHAIEGDILMWKSKFPKDNEKTQYSQEAIRHYQDAGLLSSSEMNEKLKDPIYLPDLDLPELTVVKQNNYDWKIALRSYLIGREMRKEILLGQSREDKEDEKMKLANTYLTHSGLRSAKDFVCLIEDLGVFYARLLGEIQKKSGDLTIEWLGFNF